MDAPFTRALLARLDAGRCACGAAHRVALRTLIAGEGAIAAGAARLLEERGPSPALWVVSDERTEAAAGEAWKRALRRARITEVVLPGWPRPVPAAALADELAAGARRAGPDLLVGVGSGVVSDLVKAVSRSTGVPSWCVATAPSVDAYGSATAALRVDGVHQALPAAPHQAVVCDAAVMAGAPRVLFLAGLGDLLAKYLAALDWAVAERVAGEPRCPVVADAALSAARAAVAAARAWQAAPAQAAMALADAGLVSGLAMQAVGSSRPAASVEHTVAHAWESMQAEPRTPEVEERHLHGTLVGAAARLVLRGYQAWYARLPLPPADPAERARALAAERPLDAVAREPALAPFSAKIASEGRDRPLDGASARARLQAFARDRDAIAAAAQPLLAELADAVALLERIGFPFDPAVLGVSSGGRDLAVRHARLLRARFTSLDLAHLLGDEPALVEAALSA